MLTWRTRLTTATSRASRPRKTHNGYFSIDKKTKRLVDPDVAARGENAGETDDVDAYDLILKDKERLLSFRGAGALHLLPLRPARRWDNPNVFVICTLKHSDNTISRRQEVGRGLRCRSTSTATAWTTRPPSTTSMC